MQAIRFVINNGELTSIYNDALVPLMEQADTVKTERASHVEPNGKAWDADMSPVGGPMLSGFTTRAAALAAEVKWLDQNIIQ